MALIHCAECGQVISDKAKACQACGAPVTITKYKLPTCPKCGSPDLVAEKTKPSTLVALATGGVNLAAHAGSKNIKHSCKTCGHTWRTN